MQAILNIDLLCHPRIQVNLLSIRRVLKKKTNVSLSYTFYNRSFVSSDWQRSSSVFVNGLNLQSKADPRFKIIEGLSIAQVNTHLRSMLILVWDSLYCRNISLFFNWFGLYQKHKTNSIDLTLNKEIRYLYRLSLKSKKKQVSDQGC